MDQAPAELTIPGMQDLRIRRLAFGTQPVDPVAIEGYGGSAIYKSTDGGDNWTPINEGLPDPQFRGRIGPFETTQEFFSKLLLECLEPGMVAAGDAIELVEKGPGRFTVSEANRLMYRDRDDLAAIRDLLEVPALADDWRISLEQRL